MVDALGGTYNTGTLSVTQGETTVTIDGALLTTQAVRGDWLWVPSANYLGFIESVTDDENIVLQSEWTPDTQTDVEYLLIKMSWSRYDPAITQAKIRELLAYYEAAGFFYFVAGAEPDPALGKEGQWALKINGGAWRLWYYTEGEWVDQGFPAGLEIEGIYDPGVTYAAGVVVAWQGKLWKSLVASNVGNQPDTSPSEWGLALSGGDRYDIQFFDTDRPASNELINKLFPVGVTFPVGLSESHAEAEVAATASAVYSFKKNGTTFATLTFGAGQTVGTWECLTEIYFDIGDELTQWAPTVRDATLSGVGGNLIGYRNVGA
jgi:hypothetical protein